MTPGLPVFPSWTAREAATGALDMTITAAWWVYGVREPLINLGLLMAYAHACNRTTHSRRVRKVDDIDGLVDAWHEVLLALATVHDHETRARADHRTDELLTPLLTAPIGQVREFVQKLARRLREDERVPFMVWSSFERVVTPVVLKGPDGETLSLRKGLAEEIAVQVEQLMDRADLVKAIAGALQWRPPTALERVKKSLDTGTMPRITGRESCLFLEVGDEMVVL